MSRRAFYAFAALAALALTAQPEPAAAAKRGLQASGIQDTYCLQGRQWGYPGNCQFSSYEQCMATAIGTDSGCGMNPARAAYGAQARDPRGPYGPSW